MVKKGMQTNIRVCQQDAMYRKDLLKTSHISQTFIDGA